jgi:exopolysaccharide biosynthesis polyprenyl glycosylphosphotransferase
MPSENNETHVFSVAGGLHDGVRPHRRPEAFPRYEAARERAASAVADTTIPVDDLEVGSAAASRERIYRRSLAVADALAAAASAALVFGVIAGNHLNPLFLLVMPAIVLAAKTQGLYDRDELVIHKTTLGEFPRLLNLGTLFALVLWISRKAWVSGTPRTLWLLALWLLLIATLTTFRALARAFASQHSSAERLLLVGSEVIQRRVESKVSHHPNIELVGAIEVEHVARDPRVLRRTAALLGAHRVMIALSDHEDAEETMDVVRGAMASGLAVSLLPSALGVVGSSVAFDDLGGMPLLGVPRFGLTRSSRLIKRAFDLAGACAALILSAPILLVTAIMIRLESHGPVLFRQIRVGRDGQPFTMLKLRTMVDGAEEMKDELRELNEAEDGLFKISDDPRITRIGRFLRRTSLDELPQLFNVLRGDMSLVGPRPLVLDEDKRVTGYDRRRLHLTPGMTGRWQTLGSARIPLSEMVKIDYLYVANWSLWADLKIMLETVAFVVHRRGL